MHVQLLRSASIVLTLAAAFAAFMPGVAQAQFPFFPGAEGFGGSFSGTAPAGGWFSNATVYHVTRLDDDLGTDGKGAPGTLRGAFRENTSNKIIVFDVAGTIQLTNGKLDIKNLSNYYIAGQTAPGPVTVYGDMTQLTHSSGKENRNVVLRYLSFRKGTGDNDDAITFSGGGLGTNLILDHVSASWSEDEILSVANNNTNVTVQYSTIHDALVSNHAYGSLIRPKVSSQVSFHHNLYAHNASRQARFGTYNAERLTTEFVNNVIYNWRDRASYAGGSSDPEQEYVDVNYIGNYLIAGPGTGSNTTKTFYIDKNVDVRLYESGNFIDSDKQFNPGGVPNGSNTGWNNTCTGGVMCAFGSGSDQTFQLLNAPLPFPAAPPGTPAAATSIQEVTRQSAIDAYWQVIDHVGNWWWERDAIDSRVVNNALNNTGSAIGASAPPTGELNGLLSAPQANHPAGWDSDNDGMPDHWEIAHGLNPNSLPTSPDWKQDFDNDGYINLIEYINEAGEFPAPTPLVFSASTTNRYARITNWKTDDGGSSSGSFWQPSKYDEAQINSGTAVVDAVGQHAGLLILGANPGNNATLTITDGWLEVADAVVIGGDDAAIASLNLSGGMLKAQTLAKGLGGAFSFTDGVLQVETVGFDLENQGGMFAPGNSIAAAHVMGDLTLSGGALEIEIATENLSDSLQVDGNVALGGSLDVSLLDGFTPQQGASWQILVADGNIDGAFATVTAGYTVQKQGSSLVLFFGSAPALEGDFNDDGFVDAADYVWWRKNSGTAEEYLAWRSNFGASSSLGSGDVNSAKVPEPTSGALALVLAVCLKWRVGHLRIFGSFLQE